MNTVPRTVALVSPRYAPAIGGVERHVEMLARGLVARGLTVEVITTDPGGTLPPTEERDGVVVRRFATVAGDAVFFVAPRLGWWLLRNAHRYDLIHAHSYHTPLAFQAAIAARAAQRPLVLTPHYHGTGHSMFRTLLHRPYKPVGMWLMAQARRVICVSAIEQRLLHEHFGSPLPTVVIPNGVDRAALVAPQPRAADAEGYRVLSVGRLDFYKQADRIAKALPYLPRSYAVTILGDGPARPSIQQLVPDATARLRVPGHVSHEDLQAAYGSADVFVTLSRQESFGMTVLEAAAAGVPVVASDIPAHREVARYVAPGRVHFVDVDCTPMALARQIEQTVALGRARSIANWPIPTWDGATTALLKVYALASNLPRPAGIAEVEA